MAEPLNAISNLAFLIAAFFVSRDIKKHQVSNKAWWLLTLLIAATGLGSLLFHLFSNAVSQMLDIAALLLFQVAYLWLYFQLLNLVPVSGRIMVLLLFLLSVYFLSAFPYLFNGSLLYAPTVLILLGMSVYHLFKYPSLAVSTQLATALFMLSLVTRSIDLQLCEVWPVGTHFLWHLFNAMVMLMMCRVLMGLRRQVNELEEHNRSAI